MGKPVLQIVIASTRPGRVGLPVAEWFRDRAAALDAFEIEVVDHAEVNLPFMNEPHHPRLRQYVHQHTKEWSATVERGDALLGNTDPEFTTHPVGLVDTDEFRLVPFRSPAGIELFRYAQEQARRRREHPTDDVISDLLAPKIDGEVLSEHEFNNFFTLLVAAGNEAHLDDGGEIERLSTTISQEAKRASNVISLLRGQLRDIQLAEPVDVSRLVREVVPREARAIIRKREMINRS